MSVGAGPSHVWRAGSLRAAGEAGAARAGSGARGSDGGHPRFPSRTRALGAPDGLGCARRDVPALGERAAFGGEELTASGSCRSAVPPVRASGVLLRRDSLAAPAASRATRCPGALRRRRAERTWCARAGAQVHQQEEIWGYKVAAARREKMGLQSSAGWRT